MKRLITNADDFGADEARNAGIVRAVEAGVITSISVMTTGPAFPDTLRYTDLLSRHNISIGLHLNFSEGCPLTQNLRLLAGPDGLFLGKARAHALLSNQPHTALIDEISRESAAQIEALFTAGCGITHMDGHQHIHIFPSVIETIVRTAETFRIPWLRIPEEPIVEGSGDRTSDEEVRFYGNFARESRKYMAKTPVRTTDHFRGLSLKGRMTTELLLETLMDLPEGLTELMVHPGRAPSDMSGTRFSPFSNHDREIELASLTSPEFRNALDTCGILLTPFPAGNS